jgi:hypothetical protein
MEVNGKGWSAITTPDEAGIRFVARSRIIARMVAVYVRGERDDVPEPSEEEIRKEMEAVWTEAPPLA